MTSRVILYPDRLRVVLNSPQGDVGKWLGKEGVRIVNRAKRMVTGPPHGYWKGSTYPSAPGGPPGVRTGRGRASIGYRLVMIDGQVCLDVGAAANYMMILERRTHAPYPWLVPAAEACGYSITKR